MEIDNCPTCGAKCTHFEYGGVTNRYGGHFPPLQVVKCTECAYSYGHQHGKDRTIEEHNAKIPENKHIGIILL